MTQLEFYKSFQFMIELLLAEGMFLFRLRRRRLFWLRLVLALAACFGFACVFPVRSATPAYLSCMFLLLFLFHSLGVYRAKHHTRADHYGQAARQRQQPFLLPSGHFSSLPLLLSLPQSRLIQYSEKEPEMPDSFLKLFLRFSKELP